MTEDLSKIADDISSLIPLFNKNSGNMGWFLSTEHASRFKSLAIEAQEEIDDVLGHANGFSLNLINAVNSGENGFFGGPTVTAVSEAAEIVRGAIRQIQRKRERRPAPTATVSNYVSLSRISELKALPSDRWDFTRLIELCRELNVASANSCHMTTSFLVRSILNHVPPVFGLETFAQVASNFPFERSLKPAMVRLQGQARDGADFHLHQPIRKHETLPTEKQVAFAPELDVLLGEVIRVARQGQ
ncbi:MAG: hypothetical protein JSR89_06825 [Proteobacteria bacterium]|nr:hypothetical protein [Pseudomonadota bacterium]